MNSIRQQDIFHHFVADLLICVSETLFAVVYYGPEQPRDHVARGDKSEELICT